MDAYRVQKQALDPCELNLQVVMSCMIQALGTESSGSMELNPLEVWQALLGAAPSLQPRISH